MFKFFLAGSTLMKGIITSCMEILHHEMKYFQWPRKMISNYLLDGLCFDKEMEQNQIPLNNIIIIVKQ